MLFCLLVLSNSLRPHGLQNAWLPCPSQSSGVCPLNWWCHPTVSSPVSLLSFCLQSLPASRSFPMSQLFASGSQNARVKATVLPMNFQGWFSLRLTGLISLLSKQLLRVYKQLSSNFMTSVIIHSDFRAKEEEICHCFHLFPFYLPWSDGTRCHDVKFY